MRPKSIVTFERVVLASLALSLLATWLGWERAATTAADAGLGTGFILSVQAVTIVVMLLLLYFIARKGSPIAKWIYVVLAALGVLGGLAAVGDLMEQGGASIAVTVLQYVLTIVSLWLLFRPDAKAWFNDGRGEAA